MSQRKIYVVQREMQGKFTLTLLMLIFLVTVISFCNLYVIGQYALDHIATMQEGQTMGTLFAEAFTVLWPRLLLIILVNVIIVVIIGVFYSHQFAGPSYKLEKSIREIAQGDLSFKIYLRKGDTMHNVADSLNQLVDNFRNVIVKANELTRQIREATENYDVEEEGQAEKSMGQVRAIAMEFEDNFGKFQTGGSGGVARDVSEDSEDASGKPVEQAGD